MCGRKELLGLTKENGDSQDGLRVSTLKAVQ